MSRDELWTRKVGTEANYMDSLDDREVTTIYELSVGVDSNRSCHASNTRLVRCKVYSGESMYLLLDKLWFAL